MKKPVRRQRNERFKCVEKKGERRRSEGGQRCQELENKK